MSKLWHTLIGGQVPVSEQVPVSSKWCCGIQDMVLETVARRFHFDSEHNLYTHYSVSSTKSAI
jgi:hypothetical protein